MRSLRPHKCKFEKYEVTSMVDTEKGEADRAVVLARYPDAFCTCQPGGLWFVMRSNPYQMLSKKCDSADEAWADAANAIRVLENLQHV